MYNSFIILAAGNGKRFNSKIPKVYTFYKGKQIIQHSIDKIIGHKKINKIIIVINKKHKNLFNKIYNKKVKIVYGGKNRAESAFNGLKSLKKYKVKKVFIHDAARPNFSINLLNRLYKNLDYNTCVIPTVRLNDSIKLKNNNKILNLKRENIYITQTPQGFIYKDLFELQKNKSSNITDDSSLFINAKKKIKFITGEVNNFKITTKKDIKKSENIKYGIGFDVHRLVPKKKLYLGGLKIKSHLGTLGHSDGDPVLHAITDALLGACKMGDIGEIFSNKNKKIKNIRSTILLGKVIEKIKNKHFYINNLDINIIAQKPKIQKYKNKMINIISKICEISKEQINIKGKTTEKLGVIGKEKAIACEVIVSVIKYV